MTYVVIVVFMALLFVLGVLFTDPDRRNPHVDAKRSKWWTRNPK